ncbi:acyl-CoA N-acyltransferase [Delitschia confertaspora ATCC 74209]|uniref:Acyl-CoA N-acyltransferase n=1 Tax=Delitschia confertaspora ATCC 74209 TaxID=1513339 RepID=A0A9P4MV56_9PLEO|nr:acyl-CoA N-acyltransferase [Delitschia confertaspora ATCC 74209]
MPVIVKPYDPLWPTQFLQIKARFESLFHSTPIISIEHIGGTSVPHLASKPIIDIDIIVSRLNLHATISTLESHGFLNFGDRGVKDRYALRDPEQEPLRNVYVVVENSFQLRNHLAVRDTLRKDAQLRAEYAAVKIKLASQDAISMPNYVEGKIAILQKILSISGMLTEQELFEIRNANLKGQRFSSINTERLVLREFSMDDIEAFHALESREEVVQFQSFGPKTLEDANKDVKTIIINAAESPREHYELAVLHDGKFIGRVGANVRRGVLNGEVMDIPHADLWFSFMPEAQRRGFATEAVRAFIPLLAAPMELEIECDPRNTGSWKLAEKLGFKRISLTERAFEIKGEMVGSLVYQKVIEV